MAETAPKQSPPMGLPTDYYRFVFPALTQDRAEQIAEELFTASGSNDRVLLLAVELAAGLAPTAPTDPGDIQRTDACGAFTDRALSRTRAFDAFCVQIKQQLATPDERSRLYSFTDGPDENCNGGNSDDE